MSSREYAKNLFSTWNDDDFCRQPVFDKLLFQVLNGQRAVNAAGIQPINFTRWRKAMRDGDTLPTVERLREALDRMELRGFVFLDEDTGEVLIRSRIRRDELDKQPTVFLSALRILAVIDSPKFAAVMLAELGRMVNPEVKGDSDFAKKLRVNLNQASTAARQHLTTLSEGYSEPSPIPNSEPSTEGYAGGYSRPGETGPFTEPSPEGSPIPSVSGSVSVSNSPTENGYVGGARAGETDEPTRADRRADAARVKREPGVDPAPDPEPPEYCPKHRPDGDPDADCGPCGGYRRLHKRWLARQPTHTDADPTVATRRRFWSDVRACPHCGDTGFTDDDPSQGRCPHHDWANLDD